MALKLDKEPYLKTIDDIHKKKENIGKRDYRMLRKRLQKSKSLLEFIKYLPPSQRGVIGLIAKTRLNLHNATDEILSRIPCEIITEKSNKQADLIGIFYYNKTYFICIIEYKTSSIKSIEYKNTFIKVHKSSPTIHYSTQDLANSSETNLIMTHIFQTVNKLDTITDKLRNVLHFSSRDSIHNQNLTLSTVIYIDGFIWVTCKIKQIRNVICHLKKSFELKGRLCLLKRLSRSSFDNQIFSSMVTLFINKSMPCFVQERNRRRRMMFTHEKMRLKDNTRRKQLKQK